MKIDIVICTHKRPTELALLLQGLRTQTHQDFDVYITDDRSQPGIEQHHFLMCIITRMRLEGHKVVVKRNEIRVGVSRLRREQMELLTTKGDGELILTIDDDVIPQPDYLELLHKGIEEGYDIVSGVTPPMMTPNWKRDTQYVKPYVDNIEIDKEGNITRFDDNCGYEFIQSELIPSLHYRSGALFRKKVMTECFFPENLGFCSFREEEFLGWQAHIKGFRFAIQTGAIIYHQLTPSGGNRTQEYHQNIARNVEKHKEWTKELYVKCGYDFIQRAKEAIHEQQKTDKKE